MQNKKETRWAKIESFLRKNAYIQNADVQQLLDVSPATASRILAALTKEGKLMQIRNGRYWTYKLPDYRRNIQTAYLRYAIPHCCCCVKKLN